MAPRDSWRDRLEDRVAGRRPRPFESAVAHLKVGDAPRDPAPAHSAVPPRRRGLPRNPLVARIALATALILPAVVVGLPLLRDGPTGPCGGLERRILARIEAGASVTAFDPEMRALAEAVSLMRRDVVLDGTIARRHVAARGDDRPAWLGCYARWWSLAFIL